MITSTVDVFNICIKTKSNEGEQCVKDIVLPVPPAVLPCIGLG